MVCPSCGGTGKEKKYAYDGYPSCDTCVGTGRVKKVKYDFECSACSGSGKELRKNRSTGEYDYKTCRQCRGSGNFRGTQYASVPKNGTCLLILPILLSILSLLFLIIFGIT